MQPIVDGMENKYQEVVEFQRINAGTPEGLELFNAYSLFGHPGFLILDEMGEILWQVVGEQPVGVIEKALQSFLDV